MKTTRLPPEGSLALEWVFGYNGHTAHNNIKINAEGNLVYFVAAVAVVHDCKKHKQVFFNGHSDDITSLAINSGGDVAATGQVGDNAYIAVWNAITCDPLSVIHDAHDAAVNALAFSSDSKLIASIGPLYNDTYLIVWDWRKGRRMAQCVAHSSKVKEVEFHPNDSTQLATCGESHTRFWKIRGNVLENKGGLFIDAPKEDQQSLTFLDNDRLVTGSSGGHLLEWVGEQVFKVLENIHLGGVTVTETFNGGVITGGQDGTVLVFDKNLNQIAKFPEVPSLVYGKAGPVQSLSSNGNTIVIGTQQNEIWSLQWSDEKPMAAECIVQGHGQGEVWGLATHPSHLICATASDDKTLRLWSLEEFAPMVTRVLDDGIRSVTFHPEGSEMAVGLLHGSFIVCDSSSLNEVKRVKDRKEARHSIRFSPNGKLLAVGSNDNFVDIYDVSKKYQRLCELSGASSFVSHLDWSKDSNHIQVNSGAGERLLFQINGKGNAIVDKLPEDVVWASWTCVLGKDVDGLWAKYTDINDINAVDANFENNLIVSGDDFGLLKLFRFPCPKRGSKPRSFVGHSEHVTNVRWTFNSNFIVSVGGADHGVFVWRFRKSRTVTNTTDTVSLQKIEEDSDEDVIDTEDELEAIPEVTGEVDEELSNSKTNLSGTRRRRRSRTLSCSRHQQRVEIRDDSVFAKRRNFLDVKDQENTPPPYRLNVDHVFGYRSYDCRNNCHWLRDQRVVYHVAAVAVICDPESGGQDHYLHHTDDIISLTVHPDGILVASGQVGHNPSVQVWDSSSLKILSYLEGGHERGVNALAFSADGDRLASVGMDDCHTVVVWKWKKGQKITSVRNYTKKVFGVCFSHTSINQLLTYGVRHIRVWTIIGSGMAWRKIKLGSKFKTDTALCCAVLPADSSKWAIGLSSGNILIISPVGVEKVVKAHKGAVFSIFTSSKDINSAWSGGRDGLICEWNQQFEKCLKSFPVSDHSLDIDSDVTLLSSQNNIRALAWNKDSNRSFLIGTQNSEVLLMNADGAMSILQQGHGNGEVWGLASHPKLLEFVSVSDDRTLRRWSLDDMKATGLLSLRKPARSVHFHPKGMMIAVGFLDGSVALLTYPLLKRIGGSHHRHERISDVKFSPDGRILAVASHDSFVDLYVVDTDGDIVSQDSKGLKRLGVCRDASSFITHVTWHKDSRLLQINSGAGEQLFYEAPKGTRLLIPEKSEELLAWDSPLTCPLDVTLSGIWQPSNDLSDINAVATAPNLPLVASASDEGGLVKLFTYPCMGNLKRYRRYGAHSSHVTNVTWSYDDAFVITSGGADTSIIVWRVTEETLMMREEGKKDQPVDALHTLRDPDIPEEDVTLKDYEISGLDEVSPLPPVLDSRRRTFDSISTRRSRRGSEQFLIAVQKLRALPIMRGDSDILFLSQNDIRKIKLEDSKIESISTIHKDHESPISAMTISESEPCMVASAEMIIPLIHIWHPHDGNIITKLNVEGDTKIITCLSFCKNGRFIAALSDASAVHVFNWIKGKHISKAKLKAGGVIDIKFSSETTVAALTPKALFLCDMIGNALLPTRTLVPPGILPDPNIVLTSLSVNDEENVIVGCSDKAIVEWSGRVAVKRSYKGAPSGNKKGTVKDKTPTSSATTRLIVTVTKDCVYTAHRAENDIIIQVFKTADLKYLEEYKTPAPNEQWKPSAMSFGGTFLVLGSIKTAPFLLFNTAKKIFKVLQTDTVPKEANNRISRQKSHSKPTNQPGTPKGNSKENKINEKPKEHSESDENKSGVKQSVNKNSIEKEFIDSDTGKDKEKENETSTEDNNKSERKNSRERKTSWFRKWLAN